MMGSGQNGYLFTASQLEEFKHQALIYDYMVSGVPVPTDLLSALKRKLDFSSTLFLHKQVRWGSYRKRFNRKEDLEPERCKRTDGKKWRCSRESRRESRYCERHMHRGRNNSRKPVTIATNTTSPVIKIHSNSVHDQQTSALIHPASLYSQSSSRQNSSTQQLFLESGSFYRTNKDYRFMQGMRDGERAFFPMDSKTKHISHKASKISSSDYFEDERRQEEGRELKQHSFIIGNDFKAARSINVDTDEKNQDNFHHFFGEWPLEGKAPWLDNREKHSDHASASLSNTQLSTSTPLSTLELFQPNPTVQWF